MPNYKSRRIMIEAQQLRNNADDLAKWCGGRVVAMAYDSTDGPVGIEIPTLEGVMLASPGDFIIKGTHGEFYPVKAHIFTEKYEEQ